MTLYGDPRLCSTKYIIFCPSLGPRCYIQDALQVAKFPISEVLSCSPLWSLSGDDYFILTQGVFYRIL